MHLFITRRLQTKTRLTNIFFHSRHLRSFEILICMTDIFAVNTLLNMSCREKYDLQHTYGVLVEWLHL